MDHLKLMCEVEEDQTNLFSQSVLASIPAPKRPLRNVVMIENPPDLDFSFEIVAVYFVEGYTSSSTGGHVASDQCGVLSEVITPPSVIGPAGGKSQFGGKKYSGVSLAIVVPRMLESYEAAG